MAGGFPVLTHRTPLVTLQAMPDPRYRPHPELRVSELDWPVVPLLNALIEAGERPIASCAGGELSLLGMSSRTVELARMIIRGAGGGHLLCVYSRGDDPRVHLRFGWAAARHELEGGGRPEPDADFWLHAAHGVRTITAHPAPAVSSAEAALIAMLAARVEAAPGCTLPGDTPGRSASYLVGTRSRSVARVASSHLCIHLGTGRCGPPGPEDPFVSRPVHLRLALDSAGRGHGLAIWEGAGGSLTSVGRLAHGMLDRAIAGPERGLG